MKACIKFMEMTSIVDIFVTKREIYFPINFKIESKLEGSEEVLKYNKIGFEYIGQIPLFEFNGIVK